MIGEVESRARIVFEEVDGVLLLDKPVGLSSNQALQKARRLCRAKKAGHTGTLDPMASGLLPVCFGEATKFSGFSLDADKTYRATLRLGVTTTTGDAEGETVETVDSSFVTESALLSATRQLTGEIEQVPPMFSALKYQGKALYHYARAGETIERAARHVTIHRLDVAAIAWPDVEIVVTCSKGTYIRTLAEDIGHKLGCGAHLVVLRREAIGATRLVEAVSLEALASMAEPREVLKPADALLGDFPDHRLSVGEAEALYQGRLVENSSALHEGLCRLYVEASFVGLGRREGKTLRSSRLLRRLPELSG